MFIAMETLCSDGGHLQTAPSAAISIYSPFTEVTAHKSVPSV